MLQFSIITITSFVTLLDEFTILIGSTFVDKNKVKKLIPLFSMVYGLCLGIAGYFTKNVEMGSNIIEAIFIGLSAGAAATGVNQVSKQLNKPKREESVLNDPDVDAFFRSQLEIMKKYEDDIEVEEEDDIVKEIDIDE